MLHKRSFKPAKCKTALNLAKSRIKLMKNKKAMQLKQLKREVAQLLESGQDQTARIRVEHVVREEKMIEAYEMIEIYCELVVARLPIIESQKNCPLDLKEAIASLIFAAPRCGDIVELQDVRKHFTAKYGKEFVSAAVEIRPGCGVSRNLVEKLSAKAPDGEKKVKILTAIAEEHNIKWEPNWFKDEDPMPSADIPKVPVAHTLETNKIQMQPLDFEIAEDLEEKHAHDKTKPGTSSQSYAHPNNDSVPPSFRSHPASRPPENFSEKMVLSQPSHSAESTSMTGRQNWNMEFKDANAAAQAAAESAERASLAARAAAQFSSRSNVMSGSSSETGHQVVHSQSKDNCHDDSTLVQRNQVHGNSVNDLYNQRSSRMENDSGVNQQDSMREEGDAASVTDNSIQYGAQYETGKLDVVERRNRRKQTRDSDSDPSISGAEPNMFRSSYLEEYKIDSSENPFHEDTVERKNHSSNLQYQSSDFGDNYGVFEKSKYDDYKHGSGDSLFGSSSRKAADQEDWQVRNAYTYGADDTNFKDHRVGSDSHSDIFVGMNHQTGNYEKGIDLNADVHFDESDSDDDDVYTLSSAVEHNLSPAEPATKGFSLNQDEPHYERDLSESFRKSSIYSELIKPLPVTFDDSDGASSGSEKELKKGKPDPEFPGYDSQKPDANPDLGLMRSSHVRKGTDDSFTSSEHVEENQNRYYGSASKYKSSFHDSDASPPYNYTSSPAVSTNFEGRSGFTVLDEEKPQKSLQSRIPESQLPVSEFEYEAQPRPDGMGLNLGSLRAGRRNRAQWRIPRAATEAAPSDTYGATEKASTHELQVSNNETDNKQVPEKMSRIHMHYDPPDDKTEVLSIQKDSNSAGSPYKPTSNKNVSKISPKHPTRYFDSDESSSEEDVPKPVMSKTFVDAGLSRRTKGSAPRSVASSETSAAASKTRRPSIPYATEVSSSRIADQSSWDGEASDDDNSLNSSMEDKSTIPTKSPRAPEASNSNEKAPSRDDFTKNPSHVHPKLPDFETFAATLQSLRKNH